MLNGWRYEDGSEVEAFGHQTAALVRLNSGGEAGISYTVLQEIPDTYSLFFRADCHSAELFVNGVALSGTVSFRVRMGREICLPA